MPMSREHIIEHLAAAGSISKEQARAILESLVRLVYREARHTFTIPGLCQFELVDKEGYATTDPATGEVKQVPARKVLKIRPTQTAQDMVNKVPSVTDTHAGDYVPPAPAPEKSPVPLSEPIYMTFKCTSCGSEIEASTDMEGMEAKCPGCGSPICVPSVATISQLAGIERLGAVPAGPAPEGEEEYQKGSTIRIEVPQGFAPLKAVKRTVYIKRRR